MNRLLEDIENYDKRLIKDIITSKTPDEQVHHYVIQDYNLDGVLLDIWVEYGYEEFGYSIVV